MLRRAAVCLVCCYVSGVIAQNPSFRTEANVVQVPVRVKTKKGEPVEGLTARDFKLLDDGIPREVTVDVFETGQAPISLVIAVQSAGISTPALKKIRKIGGLIEPLVTGVRGQAAVVSFDSEITWLTDFTGDSTALQNAMKSIVPGALMQARMFDAIAEIAERMKSREGRKVLLLISETRDRGSKTTFDRAAEAIARQGIEVFGAHYSAYAATWISKPEDLPPPSDPNYLTIFTELARLGKTNAIHALTTATGGSDFPFLKERGIENAIEKLGVEVHSQYVLSFSVPPDATGSHKIDVSVPENPGILIRARQSYWAR
jgi:VWFA-related protein